ncbi:DKNYY domain-containing protein [uncultured Tenacibaculum sp.]|uniref:DKNYY domain-containing protein n=1 Tax=uncultured Tenacibaculum sp. TaxID=174713 RepID=UPI00261600CD|nr:DKNYY domain-containing protein [uncultured Tenacibaculum sp.]
MKNLIIILTFSIFLTSCKGQNRYFEPTGIVDKTAEYVNNGKSWVSLKDKESIDGYTKIGDSIFGGEIACNIEPIKGIDIKTFKVLAGTKYAKDKENVYYPIEIPCIDYTDCGVCFYGKVIMETANPESFEYLGKEYATDGKNVYFRGELINQADGKTFKVIDGPEFFFFATDKNYVFKHNDILKDIDAKTFYYDKTDKRNIVSEYEHKFIIGDKNKEWEFIPPNTIKGVKKQ